jgi:DeoR/GlpR family transcriptional regulator of sugar metabolism
MKKYTKEIRQKLLLKIIKNDPFLIDKELADRFNVSIQTIRLDRLELQIPEARERTKNVARSAYTNLRSVNEREVIGELSELKLNKYAESYLKSNIDMALEKSHIIRGHYLFAQANSLAVALINAENVLTGSAKIKFHQVVKVGDIVKARAVLQKKIKNKFLVSVSSFIGNEIVFTGVFLMCNMDMEA